MNELYVRDHIAALQAEAAAERVSGYLRSRPAAADFDRPGIRGALGRALIMLGSAISGSGQDARAGQRARPVC